MVFRPLFCGFLSGLSGLQRFPRGRDPLGPGRAKDLCTLRTALWRLLRWSLRFVFVCLQRWGTMQFSRSIARFVVCAGFVVVKHQSLFGAHELSLPTLQKCTRAPGPGPRVGAVEAGCLRLYELLEALR